MTQPLARQIALLGRMTVKELREKYAEAFGTTTHAANKDGLARRIAWRLQERAEGGLSERARRRAAELADDADLRVTPPREALVEPEASQPAVIPLKADGRVPP